MCTTLYCVLVCEITLLLANTVLSELNRVTIVIILHRLSPPPPIVSSRTLNDDSGLKKTMVETKPIQREGK
jgi:hypothetical protein